MDELAYAHLWSFFVIYREDSSSQWLKYIRHNCDEANERGRKSEYVSCLLPMFLVSWRNFSRELQSKILIHNPYEVPDDLKTVFVFFGIKDGYFSTQMPFLCFNQYFLEKWSFRICLNKKRLFLTFLLDFLFFSVNFVWFVGVSCL